MSKYDSFKAKSKVKAFEVDGFGTLHFRPPTLKELIEKENRPELPGQMANHVRNLADILCDEGGTLLFTEEDLGQWGYKDIMSVYEGIHKLNPEAVEEEVPNSQAVPSPSSSTD